MNTSLIVVCPHCNTRVLPKSDGSCPSCQYDISNHKPAKHAVQTKSASTTQEVENMAFRQRVSILGITVGSIADIVGSTIGALFIMMYVMASYHLLQTTSSPQEVSEKLLTIFQSDPLIFSINLIVGVMFSILGGYISAYIARHNELLNGALSSFLCILSGIYALFTGSYPIFLIVLEIVSFFISPVLGMFGGYLRVKQKNRKRTQIMSPA